MDDMTSGQEPKIDGFDRLRDDTASGIVKLAVLALGDLREVEDAISAGDFSHAANAIAALAQKVNALRFAEDQIASLGAGMILRVRDLQVGMEVAGMGVVLTAPEVGEERCESGRHMHPIARLRFEDADEDAELHPDAQVVVSAIPQTAG